MKTKLETSVKVTLVFTRREYAMLRRMGEKTRSSPLNVIRVACWKHAAFLDEPVRVRDFGVR